MNNAGAWVVSTPEATLRAESLLLAFSEGRHDDMAAVLTTDYSAEGPTDPVHLLVSLICIADRAIDYATLLHQKHELESIEHHDLLREAAKTVAKAYYQTSNPDAGDA